LENPSLIGYNDGYTFSTQTMRTQNDLLTKAAQEGDVERLRTLLAVTPVVGYDCPALFLAIQYGHTECVKLLIPVSHIKTTWEEAVGVAAHYKQAECLKVLLEHKPSNSQADQALVISARNNDCGCLALLLPHTNPKANHSKALYTALNWRSFAAFEMLLPFSAPEDDPYTLKLGVYYLPSALRDKMIEQIPASSYEAINQTFLYLVELGDIQRVCALLPKADLTYSNSQALRTALEEGNLALAEVLCDGSDLRTALDVLREDGRVDPAMLQWLTDVEQARRQQDVLRHSVEGVATNSARRKL